MTKGGGIMKLRLLLQLCLWIFILILMVWVPETGVLVFIGIVVTAIYKKIKDIPIITFKIKKK